MLEELAWRSKIAAPQVEGFLDMQITVYFKPVETLVAPIRIQFFSTVR
jgi:hypothetical protein